MAPFILRRCAGLVPTSPTGAALKAPVRVPEPSSTAVLPALRSLGGLYVAEVYFEVTAETARSPLELTLLFDGGGRVRIDGSVVHERRARASGPRCAPSARRTWPACRKAGSPR